METAMQYFDSDGSGSIDRNELNEGFKMMKVTLNEALIKNLFCILDSNNDNEISLLEFEAVFGKYLGTGGPVQDVKAEDLVNDHIDEETAIDLAKQMKAEQKQTVQYDDVKLEAMDQEKLDEIEEQRVQDIQAGTIEE